MKKLILLLAATLVTGGMYAQGVSAGLKVGVNFANQKFESDGISISPNGRTSFHAGLFMTAMVSETFGIQPELLYNSVGSKIDIGASDDMIMKFDYLSIPVLLRYNPIPMVNFHAGPQFGILINSVSKVGDEEVDWEDAKTLDFGFAIGAGLDLPAGLTASLRYTAGLSNIYDAEDDEDDVTMKNSVFQISVGYKFLGAGD